MSIFDIFKWNAEHDYKGPELKFGRHSDAFKDEVKLASFEEAIIQFEEEEPIKSVSYLLDFLRNDMDDNVQYDIEGDELFFELLQGSKKIIGRCNREKFVAVSEIAKISAPNIGLYRRLLERNYLLRYCRFCLNDHMELSLRFDSFMLDATPKKLYNALYEISLNADKYDDILVDEFEELSETNAGRVIPLDINIKRKKAEFLHSEIKNVLEYVEESNGHSESYHNSISYLLLYCNYKLDYLTKPEGFVMEVLERNHRLFFTNNERNAEMKNEEIVSNFRLILDRKVEQLMEEMYDTVHTFGYTKASSHDELRNLIDGELIKVSSYVNNKQHGIAEAILGYTAAYALFYFGFPSPDVDLLHLLMHILEHDYFKSLGYEHEFIVDGKLQGKAIQERIKDIVKGHEEIYPEFAPDTSGLRFDNILIFGHSFLSMMRAYNLNYKGHLVL